MQGVGNAVVGHSVQHRVAEDDLAVGLCGRVVVKHRLHVGVEQALDLRQLVDETQSQILGRLLSVTLTFGAKL